VADETIDVKALRTKLGWSQAKLAQEIKVAALTVSRWERGGKISPLALEALRNLKESLGW